MAAAARIQDTYDGNPLYGTRPETVEATQQITDELNSFLEQVEATPIENVGTAEAFQARLNIYLGRWKDAKEDGLLDSSPPLLVQAYARVMIALRNRLQEWTAGAPQRAEQRAKEHLAAMERERTAPERKKKAEKEHDKMIADYLMGDWSGVGSDLSATKTRKDDKRKDNKGSGKRGRGRGTRKSFTLASLTKQSENEIKAHFGAKGVKALKAIPLSKIDGLSGGMPPKKSKRVVFDPSPRVKLFPREDAESAARKYIEITDDIVAQYETFSAQASSFSLYRLFVLYGIIKNLIEKLTNDVGEEPALFRPIANMTYRDGKTLYNFLRMLRKRIEKRMESLENRGVDASEYLEEEEQIHRWVAKNKAEAERRERDKSITEVEALPALAPAPSPPPAAAAAAASSSSRPSSAAAVRRAAMSEDLLEPVARPATPSARAATPTVRLQPIADVARPAPMSDLSDTLRMLEERSAARRRAMADLAAREAELTKKRVGEGKPRSTSHTGLVRKLLGGAFVPRLKGRPSNPMRDRMIAIGRIGDQDQREAAIGQLRQQQGEENLRAIEEARKRKEEAEDPTGIGRFARNVLRPIGDVGIDLISKVPVLGEFIKPIKTIKDIAYGATSGSGNTSGRASKPSLTVPIEDDQRVESTVRTRERELLDVIASFDEATYDDTEIADLSALEIMRVIGAALGYINSFQREVNSNPEDVIAPLYPVYDALFSKYRNYLRRLAAKLREKMTEANRRQIEATLARIDTLPTTLRPTRVAFAPARPRGGGKRPPLSIHAIVIDKSVPLEEARKSAESIAKKKLGFMRESGESYRFRVVPKTKFSSFVSKPVNDKITIVFGTLK